MFDSDYANSDYLFARDKVERLSKSLEDFWRLEDKGLFLVNPSSNATLFFVSRIFDQYLDACRNPWSLAAYLKAKGQKESTFNSYAQVAEYFQKCVFDNIEDFMIDKKT